MKRPKGDVVRFVLKSILHRRTARSLDELTALANAELRKVDPQYSLGGKRLREIAATMPEVRIRTAVRKGGHPGRCPVCGSPLRKAFTRNLKGRRIVQHMGCPKCGFRGSDERWLPRKYEFWVKKKD